MWLSLTFWMIPLPLCPAHPDCMHLLAVACPFYAQASILVFLEASFILLVIQCTEHCCRYTNKGRAFNPFAPTLGDSLNTAFISAVYATIESTQISSNLQFRLNCWSRSQVRYVLGDAGRSLVSGWGKKAPNQVQVHVCSSLCSVSCCVKPSHHVIVPRADVILLSVHNADVKCGHRFCCRIRKQPAQWLGPFPRLPTSVEPSL